MKDNTNKESSVQNRFTAYLMSSLMHKRISYMKKLQRRKKIEMELADIGIKSYVDFEQEYRRFQIENMPWTFGDTPTVEQLVKILDEVQLIRAILRLKEREQKILIARIFEELDFKVIGNRYEMSERQAEMAYYYIIRKIRKELEGKQYE